MTFGSSPAVLRLLVHRQDLEAGRHDDGADVHAHVLRLGGEVEAVGGADLLALAAEDAVLEVEHRLLRDGVAVRNVNGAARPQAVVELVRHLDRARQLALVAADAGVLVEVARLALEIDAETGADRIDRPHLGVGLEPDPRVVGGFRHAGRADAGRAVERGEDLVEANHHAANRRRALDEKDLEALLTQVQGGLHAGDAPADHERVVPLPHLSHRLHSFERLTAHGSRLTARSARALSRGARSRYALSFPGSPSRPPPSP